MKRIFTHKTFLLWLFLFSTINFSQSIYHEQHPDTSLQPSESSNKKPDYRNHINIPAYDPSLMPLKSVRTGTGVWTELNPKVPRVDYLGIHFINKDTGWACGGNGVVIKTTNGGVSWIIANTTVTTLLLKIHSYNGQLVVATGYDGKILRSADGGENFVQVTSGVGGGIDLWGVQMLNDSLGWVCGINATLLKTTDAGISWQQVSSGVNQHYWSLDFLNENFGMIACGSGIVLRTTNGGSTWIQTQAGDTRALYTIDVIDSLHIAAGGGPYGKNVYSSNGGVTWTQNTNLIYENGVNCIVFINADTGYAIGENWAINKTENRGLSWWASAPVYADWWLNLLPNGIGYAAGNALRLYKTSNGYDSWKKLFFTDNINDVYFIDEDEGFIIVRDPAKLYRTLDGGVSWDSIPAAPGGVDLLFLDSLKGFIASDKIYKTTDGGSNWYQTNSLGFGAGKIFFVTNQLGWATSGRSILKTTDGGENWFVQITLPADSYTSIYFIDSLNGWATSRYIWQTTNGGTNWIQRTDVQLYFNRNIYFTSIDTGFVTVDMTNTGSHDLYKTTNGGISWLRETRIETSYNIHFFPNKYHWISNGWSMGQVFETTDNGNSWEEISGWLPAIFGQFHSPIEYVGYAVSGYGLILKYFDTTYVPVELTKLTAGYSLNKIELKWSTASEVNNYGFEIWKSSDLQYWEKIGFLHGAGTSTEIRNYSFSDFKIESEQLYYKIKQIDFDGSNKFSEVVSIKIPINNFVLTQNFPNPANPNTNISFTVPQKGSVKMELFSMTGEKVTELLNEERERGIYSIEIDLKKYASGVYYYRMTTNSGHTATKKLILIK